MLLSPGLRTALLAAGFVLGAMDFAAGGVFGLPGASQAFASKLPEAPGPGIHAQSSGLVAGWETPTPTPPAAAAEQLLLPTPQPTPRPTFVPKPYSAPAPPTTPSADEQRQKRHDLEQQIALADQKLRTVTYTSPSANRQAAQLPVIAPAAPNPSSDAAAAAADAMDAPDQTDQPAG
ncbi:MAG TPA: hypothetical protein VKU60_18105 [Chloroflexota bacterium]|nr:hypothetical protein [Chloroflexota bacterium]